MSRAMIEKVESQPGPVPAPAPGLRWYAKVGLLVLSIGLLSLALRRSISFTWRGSGWCRCSWW